MSNDVLTLALTVHERKKDVAVRFNRVAHLSPELSWVTLTIDGEKRRLQLREDDEFAYVKTFLKGEHTMTLDFGGVWPAGLVTLPEETTARKSHDAGDAAHKPHHNLRELFCPQRAA